jgi:hypothetical protein
MRPHFLTGTPAGPTHWSMLCLYLSTIAWTVACSDGSESMRIWVGRQDSDLTRVWGQPSEVVIEDDAGRTLVYTSYWLSGFGKPHQCRRAFTTDRVGTITGHSALDCT